MANGCKLRPNVQQSTDVLEFARFAYPARREIGFSHDDLAWHEFMGYLYLWGPNFPKIRPTGAAPFELGSPLKFIF